MQDTDGDSRYWLTPVQDGKPQVLTGQRRLRGDVVRVETDRGGREFRSLAEPLELYVSRQTITGRQYRAGKRLHILWMKAKPALCVQVQYEEGDGGARAMSFVPPGFGAVEYREALFSITDKHARDVVYEVCCMGRHAAQVVEADSKRTARWRGAKLLTEGLDILANHFKYE